MAVIVARGTTYDSRVYIPYILSAFPAQSGTVGVAITPITVSAVYIAGGTSPTWTMTAIPGLTINSSTSVISGTPTTAGTTSFTVTCTNSAGTVSTVAVNWVVTSLTQWTYPSSISLAPSSSYDFTSAVTAGTPAGEVYGSIALAAGALPTGWTLDSAGKRLVTASNATGTTNGVQFSLTTTSTAVSDFAARTSGVNVVAFHNFDTAAEVDNFRFVGSGEAIGGQSGTVKTAPTSLCQWISSDGFAGGGCAQIQVNNGGTTQSWWRPISALAAGANANGKSTADPAAGGTMTVWPYNALNSGEYNTARDMWNHPDYNNQADPVAGNEYYVQVRVKMGANRANSSNSNGKLFYFDYGNGADCELVVRSGTASGADNMLYDMYTNFGSQNNAVLYAVQGSGSGSPAPSGSHNPGSLLPGDGSFRFPADTWITLLYRIKPGRRGNPNGSDSVVYGGTPATNNTEIQIWTDWNNQTNSYNVVGGVRQYLQIWSKNDYVWAYGEITGPGGPNGFNKFKFSGFMNSQSIPVPFTHRMTQWILSKATIPCPQV